MTAFWSGQKLTIARRIQKTIVHEQAISVVCYKNHFTPAGNRAGRKKPLKTPHYFHIPDLRVVNLLQSCGYPQVGRVLAAIDTWTRRVSHVFANLNLARTGL